MSNDIKFIDSWKVFVEKRKRGHELAVFENIGATSHKMVYGKITDIKVMWNHIEIRVGNPTHTIIYTKIIEKLL